VKAILGQTLLGGREICEHSPGMRIPAGLFTIVKEILRHLLRRPVVGISVLAQTDGGQILLIRRSDTGEWALPGGTLEWGETLRDAAVRELREEAGIVALEFGTLLGAYSEPGRDPRFHAVTLVVAARIEPLPLHPENPAEILEARLFAVEHLPPGLSHGNGDMLRNALAGPSVWE
jgi:8-oxo-dGTP diphosphatase